MSDLRAFTPDKIILNDLAHLPVWVGWRQEMRDGKGTKVPYCPRTGRTARSVDPTTWATRGEAEFWASANRGGVGIVLAQVNGGGRPLCGIDLDTCRDPATETLQGWAHEVIGRFATYTEVSPSGTGVKLFFTHDVADGQVVEGIFDGKGGRQFKNGGGEHCQAIEVYRKDRYFTVTDESIGPTDTLRQVSLADLEWLVRDAGPKFAHKESQSSEPGNDQSRSGRAFRNGARLKAARYSYAAMRDALLADEDPEIAAWARTKGLANGEREMRRIYENASAGPPPEPLSPLRVINLASLAGKEVPVRKWLVPEVILADQVTMLFGNGGDGKSLLALQLAVAVAAETDWIGYLPEPGSVLYCSAEDEPDEIHRRVADIIDGRDDLSFEALAGVNVIDLSTLDALLAVPQGRAATLTTTALFKQIGDKVTELRPSLLIIDALADVYGGDENIRGQVRQFIGFLRRLAFEHRVTVLLIAHPSVSGMASGSGTSGSTGWNNSVRGRLYLEPAPADKGDEPDPCLRKSTVLKNNRGPKGASVPLRWERGRFVLMGGMGSFEQTAADSRDDSLFLKLLKATKEQGRNVSPWGGQTHAPTVFACMPDGKGVKPARFKAAMERLLASGKILTLEEGPPSKRHTRLVEP